MSAAPKKPAEFEPWLQDRIEKALAVSAVGEAFGALSEQMMALALSVADGNNTQVTRDRDACNQCISTLEKALGKMPDYSGDYAQDLPTILSALVEKSTQEAAEGIPAEHRGKVSGVLEKAFGGRRVGG